MITKEMILAIMPFAAKRVDKFLPYLEKAMLEFSINTPIRQAAFLAQVGHESGQFLYVKETASGNAYEGRKDLGNTSKGDGVKYKGRGLIQVTGKTNYMAVMMALNVNCVEQPELLESPENAVRSACWWWQAHKCNALADSGDFRALTKRINGGYNGLEDRMALYERARKVFKV